MHPVVALRNAFRNPTERRLRAPLRIVAGGIVLVAAVIAAQVGVVLALHSRLDPASPLGFDSALVFGLSAVAAGVAVLVALVPVAWVLDKRTVADYGFRFDRDWWADCAFGLGLGVALQAAVFLVGWAAGWFTVVGVFRADGSFLLGFAALVGLFVVVGVYEEALVRGWLLTNLAEGLRSAGTRAAVVVALVASSAVFGLLHAGNPGATPFAVAVISLAGVMLAAGYLLTGELAIPIGIHVTWNLAQGAVFGHGVSGLGTEVTVVATETTGPALWTGGGFGPEGGLLGLFAVLAGCVAVVGWVRLRTGDLGIHPAVTTPTLRGDRPREEDSSAADADPVTEPVTETESDERP